MNKQKENVVILNVKIHTFMSDLLQKKKNTKNWFLFVELIFMTYLIFKFLKDLATLCAIMLIKCLKNIFLQILTSYINDI